MTTKICVYGLWHLGLVTSSCLASKGFEVVGLDTNYNKINETISNLPIHEPNLQESISKNLSYGNLSFTDNIPKALKNANILWVTFDTPLSKNDIPRPEIVLHKIRETFPYIEPNTLVIISSQLPVGSTRKLQNEYCTLYPNNNITFIYSPENLVRGKAIEGFNNPDRVIFGVDINKINYGTFKKLFDHKNFIAMSLESAEMVKHALNSFLALEISFANEVALICKNVGADYKDVESSLKSDSRIGKKAYLRAGEAYSGGTLARDVNYLYKMSKVLNIDTPIINSINLSNNLHKKRIADKL